MTDEKKIRKTDFETGEPIVYPVGTVETRLTKPGELGFVETGLALTALGSDEPKEKQIGDSDQISGPAVIGNPDLDAKGEARK